MKPEYIEELADIADPDQLWRLGWEKQKALPPERRAQLDMGVALRRHASHLRELNSLLPLRKSLLITPLASNWTAHLHVDVPAEHEKLRPERTW